MREKQQQLLDRLIRAKMNKSSDDNNTPNEVSE